VQIGNFDQEIQKFHPTINKNGNIQFQHPECIPKVDKPHEQAFAHSF